MSNHTMTKFNIFHKAVATSMGFGYSPWAPGTMGAVFAVLVWLPFWMYCGEMTLLAVTAGLILVFTPLGVWSSSLAEDEWGPDPSRVVMDESVGTWISLLPVTVTDAWWYVLLAFGLFRLFDIFKPLGIRRLEQLPSGWGIMADDIGAGIYSALIILIMQAYIP